MATPKPSAPEQAPPGNSRSADELAAEDAARKAEGTDVTVKVDPAPIEDESPQRLDETVKGGVYIVNGQRVDANGQLVKGK